MGCDEREKILLKRISSSFPNASPSRLKQGEEAAQQEFIPAFFLEEKDIQSKREKTQQPVFMRFLFAQKTGELEIQLRKRIKKASGQPRCQPEQTELGEDT